MPGALALAWGLIAALTGLPAHAAGTFTGVASANIARMNATSTLMPSGQVMIAGGYDTNNLITSRIEFYDSQANTWTSPPTGHLLTARQLHTATLLPSGSVLIVGGETGNGTTILNSAELCDASGTCVSTGSLQTARENHTATLLRSGQVLVVGGNGSGSTPLASAELYDPVSGSWTTISPLGNARGAHTATLLSNDRVLVVGGFGAAGELKSVELYDPSASGWLPKSSLPVARAYHAAVLLPSGQVAVAAGHNASGFLSDSVEYDPATDQWTSAFMLSAARAKFTATLMPSGKVLLAGGVNAQGPAPNAELCDVANGCSSINTFSPRANHTATLLPSGQVLIAGGTNQVSVLASAQRYDDSNDSFTAIIPLNIARRYHTTTLMPNGQILVAGGQGASGALSEAETYDPTAPTPAWRTLALPMLTPRFGHTATVLPSGKVLVVGGFDGNNFFGSAEIFDPLHPSDGWQPAAPLSTARVDHTATLLASGQVLVAGGINASGVVAASEIYDPASDTWTATADLQPARTRHSATLLTDGRVLVAGGINGSGNSIVSVRIFDPANGTWSPTTAMSAPRSQHTATLLPSGKVLIAGGINVFGAQTLFDPKGEIYDPAGATWTDTQPFLAPRFSHTTTLLSSGQVLMAGGFNPVFNPEALAERYDPATNAWYAAGAMVKPTGASSAAALPSGKVILDGGDDSQNNIFADAEVYDFGLQFQDSRRPVISEIETPIPQGSPLMFSGSNLTGDTEATGGNGAQSSPTNYPLVHVQRVGGGQDLWTSPDPSSISWEGDYQSQPLNIPMGQYEVTAFVNAIPSVSQSLLITGPAAQILLAQGSPQSAPVDTAFQPLEAQLLDAGNNPVSGASVTFTAPASGASAACSPSSPTTDANGIASTTCTANDTAGAYTVSAGSGALAAVNFALTNIGPPASIVTVAGTPQSTVVATPFAVALQVKVTDALDNAVPAATVTFSAPAAGAGATCSPSSAQTDASGLAQTSCVANTIAGAYAVGASTGALAPATFDLTNVSGAPASIAIASGSPQSALVGTAFPQPLAVAVTDAFDNPVASGTPVTFSALAVNGAAATCSDTQTDAQGMAESNCTANATAGEYTVDASVAGVGSPAAFDLTNLLAPTVACTLPQQIDQVAGTISLDLASLFSAPGQTLVYGATGLPPSLQLDQSSGMLTGTLTQAGSFAATFYGIGVGSASESVSFDVLPQNEIVFRNGFGDTPACQ